MLNNSYIIKSEKFDSLQNVVITLHGYGTSGADFAEAGKIFLVRRKLTNAVMGPKIQMIMLRNNYIMQKVVITLHGYGTSGADFAEVGKIFLAKKLDNVVIAFNDTGDYAEQ